MTKKLEYDKLKIAVDIEPGVFSHEKAVSFYCAGRRYSLLVDESFIRDGYMLADVLYHGVTSVQVRLPSQTITGVGRIIVPLSEIEGYERVDHFREHEHDRDPWQGIASGMLNSGSEYK